MPQFRLGDTGQAGQAAGHELVRLMAREEIERASSGNPLAVDWRLAKATYRRAYRELGVVLNSSVEELDRLDEYIYRPLRDVAFLTARSLDDEIGAQEAAGLPAQRAFQETADDWVEGFAMLLVSEKQEARPDDLFQLADAGTGAALARHTSFPYRLDLLWRARDAAARGRLRLAQDPGLAQGHERSMAVRRELFSRCDTDFLGPGHREITRVVLVTSLMSGPSPPGWSWTADGLGVAGVVGVIGVAGVLGVRLEH